MRNLSIEELRNVNGGNVLALPLGPLLAVAIISIAINLLKEGEK